MWGREALHSAELNTPADCVFSQGQNHSQSVVHPRPDGHPDRSSLFSASDMSLRQLRHVNTIYLRMFHMWEELGFMRAIMSTHFSAKSAAMYAA